MHRLYAGQVLVCLNHMDRFDDRLRGTSAEQLRRKALKDLAQADDMDEQKGCEQHNDEQPSTVNLEDIIDVESDEDLQMVQLTCFAPLNRVKIRTSQTQARVVRSHPNPGTLLPT